MVSMTYGLMGTNAKRHLQNIEDLHVPEVIDIEMEQCESDDIDYESDSD